MEFEQKEKKQLISILENLAHTSHKVAIQLESIESKLSEATLVSKTMLSLQRNTLVNQKTAFFMGKSGPKRRLVELYLSIGNGKTRKALVNEGFPKGTVLRYCTDLVAEDLLQVKETQTDGEEILTYTLIEEITQLSKHLQELLQTD